MSKNKSILKLKAAEITEKLDQLTKKELIAMVQKTLLPMTNPETYKEEIRKAMPEFVHEMDNKEDMATSIYQANQEMLLVIYDSLRRYHQFSDSELKQFKEEIYDVLRGVKEFEESGLSFLSIPDVKMLGDKIEEIGIAGLMQQIARSKLHKTKLSKMGLEIPIMPAASGMAKELTKLK